MQQCGFQKIWKILLYIALLVLYLLSTYILCNYLDQALCSIYLHTHLLLFNSSEQKCFVLKWYTITCMYLIGLRFTYCVQIDFRKSRHMSYSWHSFTNAFTNLPINESCFESFDKYQKYYSELSMFFCKLKVRQIVNLWKYLCFE